MATIKLDKQKKIVLLQALQRGEVDTATLRQWCDDSLSQMTDEELELQICELDRKLDRCDILKKHGYCPYVKGANNVKLPRLTVADIVEVAEVSHIDLSSVVAECNRRMGAK